MEIGQAIRFCRLRKRLTQPELAKRAGLSASYLSFLEKSKRDPSLSALEKIARALEMPLSVLVFIASSPSDNEGIPAEIREKLSAATLKLLMASTNDAQPPLI
jgi:transcriptional regulator with XRE-family HTH domain